MTRVALVNPVWDFAGSTFGGCREPHLPLELAYSASLLRLAGHHARIFDGQLLGKTTSSLASDITAFEPDITVITTAPSYLFWSSAPAELRAPMETARAIEGAAGEIVVVGPHMSTALRVLRAGAGVLGECEEVLVRLADTSPRAWDRVDSVAVARGGEIFVRGGPYASDVARLPSLRWDARLLARHRHHHRRFDREPEGPGAEIEASRRSRKRPLAVVLDELDALVRAGATYVYFIDDIFAFDVPLLEALYARDVRFGVQLQIDRWQPEHVDLLARAGCVAVDARIENVSAADVAALLVHAKRRIPSVQALRERLREKGVGSQVEDRP
jgi:B12-binding domain/radical SAM domain protein of rhizo-twelve system